MFKPKPMESSKHHRGFLYWKQRQQQQKVIAGRGQDKVNISTDDVADIPGKMQSIRGIRNPVVMSTSHSSVNTNSNSPDMRFSLNASLSALCVVTKRLDSS